MIRCNRTAVVVVAFLLLAAGRVFSQDTDSRILAIENGINFGYSLSTSDIGSAQELGIHLTVADNTVAGFVFIQGDATNYPSYTMFRLQYFLGPRTGVSIIAGKTGLVPPPLPNPATGAGLFLNIFQREYADTISAVLKLKLEYLVDLTLGIDRGVISVGLGGRIGL